MLEYRAKWSGYEILLDSGEGKSVYPYLRSESGDAKMFSVGPQHGRSYVVGKDEKAGRSIVSKGNGLNFSRYSFLDTKEFGLDIWGLLLEKDARRDFLVGRDVEALGIKTNKMEYVLRLEDTFQSAEGETVHPVLLQYSVECPYRFSDAAVMPRNQISREAAKWRFPNGDIPESGHRYAAAAEVLVRNLRLLHDHGILHNAITVQNYTWALELLDFELASSPEHPYEKEDYLRHIPTLMPREIVHTYQVIMEIAACLCEEIDFPLVDSIFKQYGFDLKDYALPCE